MNASTDLLYPYLSRNTEGFKSNEYRHEIEQLSIEQLNLYIDRYVNGDWIDSSRRDEKLRLCLRLRNAHLVNLPYFYTYVSSQNNDIPEYDKVENEVCKLDFHFYFFNIKTLEELEQIKQFMIENPSEDFKPSLNVFYIINEQSSFKSEIKSLLSENKTWGVTIHSEQYNHLVSRNAFQVTLMNLFRLDKHAELWKDDCNQEFNGKVWALYRYPEYNNSPATSFSNCLQLLLKKANITRSANISTFFLSETKIGCTQITCEDLKLFYEKTDFRCIDIHRMTSNLQTPIRLSMLVPIADET